MNIRTKQYAIAYHLRILSAIGIDMRSLQNFRNVNIRQRARTAIRPEHFPSKSALPFANSSLAQNHFPLIVTTPIQRLLSLWRAYRHIFEQVKRALEFRLCIHRAMERNLSFPDTASLPLLAEQLGTSVDELLEARASIRETTTLSKAGALAELVLKAVALAMGVGSAALSIMGEVGPRNILCLLGIGVACLALVQLSHTGEDQE